MSPSGRSLVYCLAAIAAGAIAAGIWWIGSLRSRPAPLFVDVLAEAGIDVTHENGARGERHLPETTAGSAGWIDHDGDGLYDLYLVSGNLHPEGGGSGNGAARNRLYRNLGGGRFADVTERAGVGDTGYGTGLAVGDYDGDGRSDLYVANYGRNVLYHNQGDGRFRDVTSTAGVEGGGWSSSAAFFDCDGDGDLDLYVCRYLDYDPTRKCEEEGMPVYCGPRAFQGLPDLLYRNRGDGSFEDISIAAGIALGGPEEGKSLGVVVLDHDGDGDSDVYVTCDTVRNLLFRNHGDGTFKEVGLLANVAYSNEGSPQAGMGVDAGDVDLDGHADLVVTNFADERNALYLSEGPGYYTEMSAAFGLGEPSFVPLGFGVLLFDFDLDSDLDLYVANGHIQDNIASRIPGRTFPQRDQLFENEAGRRFVEISKRAGPWFDELHLGRAAAGADFDGDGDEDLVVLNVGGRPALLRNDGGKGHWIGFALEGTRSNRDGYGTRVTVTARRGGESVTRVFECRSARSYAAACDPRVRCGLGTGAVVVERASFRWPSGATQELLAPEIDRYHTVVEGE